MRSSNLYSHPDKLLENHLIGVAELSTLFLSEKPVKLRRELLKVSQTIALTHDLGKATGYFQKYLKAGEDEKHTLKVQPETHHSLFSSVCTYYLAKENGCTDLQPFFAFLVVRRHHGNLGDVLTDVIFDNSDADLLHVQLESIDSTAIAILGESLASAGLPISLSKKLISQWIDKLVTESRNIKRALRRINDDTSNYIILNTLYSILLDADKSDVVINDSAVFKRKEFNGTDWVDTYKVKTSFAVSPINVLREKAYNETLNRDIDLADRIYSLNLPTGLGKTLSAFSFALKLRQEIGDSVGVQPRIVYALPFLSIIDQNAEVLESVLRANAIQPDTDVLLKHHHLSDVFYKKEDNEFETDQAKILIEGWNAEIIVTTFVQLFHTLVSNKNKSIRKFHRLANSIIILDEVQSIPIKYWMLVKTVFLKLSEMLNVYMVLATATEPLIFDKGESKALVCRDYYFNALDRVSLKPALDKTIRVTELVDYFNHDKNLTHLFILNTIAAAKELYNAIKQQGLAVTYLSTHITPKERLERIHEIKTGKYKAVISTQLVEAGVDIDFDVVVRDIAPLDSINQAAGRCNRNAKTRGKVYVVALEDDRGRKFASYIYDSVLLDITQSLLADRGEISESNFLCLIERYYAETNKKKTQSTSRELLDAIARLKYDSDDDTIAIADFKLITEGYIKRDVFIELDQEANAVWKQFVELKGVDDIFLRRRMFDAMKNEFYQYVISIPMDAQNLPPLYGDLGYVAISSLRDYYDTETGFIVKDQRAFVIW